MSKKNYPLIFIVEDNKAYSKILEHTLQLNGYTNVVPIVSGEECLKKMYLKPDIIIQDYKLQGISGLNTMQRIKKVYPHTEFVFLSGLDDINIAIDSVKQGAFYYIVKNEESLGRLMTKIGEIKTFQQHSFLKKKRMLYILFAITILVVIFLGKWLFF